MDEIQVKVVEFGDRKAYQMQYKDPVTRRKVTKSTGVERTGLKRDRTEAERVAAKWEDDLRAGRYRSQSKVTWLEFRERYETDVLPGLAEATDRKVSGVLNAVAAIINPARLMDVTADRLSHFQAKLREQKLAESTIAGHLAHLRAALQWAVNVGLLNTMPRITRPKRAKATRVMKGRPITGEEFDRLLAKVQAGLLATNRPNPKRKGKQRKVSDKGMATIREKRLADAAAAVPSWQHYLRGLWCSGLRLEESLELYWDRDDRLCVDLSGQYPMLRIPGALEKGNQDRVLPMAPEFAEFLLATPAAERTGRVFHLRGRRVGGSLSKDIVGKVVSAIGKAAGIKVQTDATSGKVKYASAHDLRRSFGERWAQRVMPQVLMQLMRHETIDTTMRYYVGRNAQTTAGVLWEAHKAAGAGNTSGNSGTTTTTTTDTASSASNAAVTG